MNQKENPVSKEALLPSDVNELFFEGDKIVWRHLDDVSLSFLTLDNQLRIFCVYVMLEKWFDRVIFLAICCNALTIAADDSENSNENSVFWILEIIFNSIFSLEFLIKIICLGGLGEKSGYFRDPWNRLDFTVLIFGWLPFLLDGFGVEGVHNFSFIRVIRILKVLKTINTIPGLKRLVKAILDAIPQLISVANLLAIIFFLFGILGTQLFKGHLRRRCFPSENLTYGYIPEDELCCVHEIEGSVQCPVETPICNEYFPGSRNANPNENLYSNFDNTAVSFLTIFVAISLEGWSSVMFSIMETSGYAACVYFIILVVIGAYFVINLVIAVIYQSYIETIEDIESHEVSFRLLVKLEEEQFKTPGEVSVESSTVQQSELKRLPSLQKETSKHETNFIKRLPSHGAIQRLPSAPVSITRMGSRNAAGRVLIRHQSSTEATRELRRQLAGDGVQGRKFQLYRQVTRQLSRQSSRGGNFRKQLSRQMTRQYTRQISTGGLINRIYVKKHPKTVSKRLYKAGFIPMSVHKFFTVNEHYLQFKRVCQFVVGQEFFDLFVVSVILFNVVVLSMEANGRSDSDYFIETSNIVFTIFFCLEVMLQMIAVEIIPYLSSGYNVLDAVIALMGVIEISLSSDSHALSVLRTLRVFRTFKLFRRWESLQELIRAIFVSGEGLGYFCIVLLLFIFVFALTGKSLFAGNLQSNNRANFDTLFLSFVTTFQLVTGENWNDILFETMNYNPTIGAIYCIVVYTLGTLVVLNIFLAILLETFSNVKDDTDSYYDKLDNKTNFQSKLSVFWHHAVSRIITWRNSVFNREYKADTNSNLPEKISFDDRNSVFSSKSDTSMRDSFRRTTQANKSKWIGKFLYFLCYHD